MLFFVLFVSPELLAKVGVVSVIQESPNVSRLDWLHGLKGSFIEISFLNNPVIDRS